VSPTAYTIVTTADGLKEALGAISGQPILGVDTETTGLDPFRSRVRLLQVATPERAFVFDLFQLPAFENAGLRSLFSSATPTKVFHNAKFDLKMILHHFGLEVRGVFDCMLASQLIDGGRGDVKHGLADVALRYIGEVVDKTMQMSNWAGPLSELQFEYAAKDAALMLPLGRELERKLAELKMAEAARLEFDCVLPIAAMELAGMAIDAACWRGLVANVQRAHDVLSVELKRELSAGIPQLTLFDEPPNINLDSPAQIVEALGRMGIKVEGTRSWQLAPLARQSWRSD